MARLPVQSVHIPIFYHGTGQSFNKKIEHREEFCGIGEKPARVVQPYPDDERPEQHPQGDGAEAVQPEIGEMEGLQELLLAFGRLRGAEIPHAGVQRAENHVKRLADHVFQHQIVRVHPRVDDAGQSGDDRGVYAVVQHLADAVGGHADGVFQDIGALVFGQGRYVLLLKVRVFPVDDAPDHQIVGHGDGQGDRAVEVIGQRRLASQQEQHGHMQQRLRTRDRQAGPGEDVSLLRGREYGGLIGVEPVGAYRFEQREDIYDAQIHQARGPLRQIRQRRDQRQAGREHHRAHHAVGPAVKVHERLDLLRVVVRHGPVHGENDARPHAQLGQIQHGEDAGEQPADAQIFLAQAVDEHRAHCKGQHRGRQIDHDARCEVFQKIGGSHCTGPYPFFPLRRRESQ